VQLTKVTLPFRIELYAWTSAVADTTRAPLVAYISLYAVDNHSHLYHSFLL
jgi:hypothetical protein